MVSLWGIRNRKCVTGVTEDARSNVIRAVEAVSPLVSGATGEVKNIVAIATLAGESLVMAAAVPVAYNAAPARQAVISDAICVKGRAI